MWGLTMRISDATMMHIDAMGDANEDFDSATPET